MTSLAFCQHQMQADAAPLTTPRRRLGDEANGKTCKLTVTTEGPTPGSATDGQFRGGILWIVSGLKTFLETGSPLPSEQAA